MFTSRLTIFHFLIDFIFSSSNRSEFRLNLRAENADFRLTPIAISLGVIGKK